MNDTAARYLERVEIANFRAYGDSFTLTMPEGPGITLIYGPNGLGKTTFFDAIEWCLTGAIRRLEKHRHGGARRPNYLTRFGAPNNSHRVSLYFSGVDPLDRGLGVVPGPRDVASILKRPSWPEVGDIGLYLSLTHFLGQSAAQRFSVKAPSDQWEALKGPAGVDRVNHIRDRLGGQGARMAFNRQIRQATLDVEKAREGISRWESLAEERDRVSSLARVQDALSPAELSEACTRLLNSLAPSEEFTSDERQQLGSPEMILEFARGALREAQERLRTELSNATLLGEIALQLEGTTAERASVDAALTEQSAKVDSDAVESALAAEKLSTLRAAYADVAQRWTDARGEFDQLLKVIQAGEEYSAAATRAQDITREIAEVEARLQSLDASISEVTQLFHHITDGISRRATLSRQASELGVAAQLARETISLRQQTEEPYRGLDTDERLRHHEVSTSELHSTRSNLAREVESIMSEFGDRDRRSGALFALTTQIAALLQEQDSTCPVCASVFPPGELLQRVATMAPPPEASEAVAERLADAYSRLAVVDSQLEELKNEIDRIHHFRTALDGITDREKAVITRARNVLPDVMIESLPDIIDVASRREQEFAAAQLAAMEERDVDSCRAELNALQKDRSEIAEQHSKLRLELVTASARIEQLTKILQQHPEIWSASDGFSIEVAGTQSRLSATAGSLQAEASSAEVVIREAGALEVEARNRLAEARTIVAKLQQRRDSLIQRSDELERQWASLDTTTEPSTHSAWQIGNAARERERRLSESEQELEQMVSGYRTWVQDTERQRLEAAVRALHEQSGTQSDEELVAHLTGSVERTEQTLTRLEQTRDVALMISDELQLKAEEYAQSILEPLSETIQNYSRALMSRTDESLFYRAIYLASRSEIRSGITRPNPDGTPMSIEMNPNLYFSEGQLSALSVSSLFAASTTFNWSRWPALLMDDPLQHNDVIHASAFIDLLRRLVQKLSYQVILSSHDADEAEFIMRKCESAGVRVQMCELRPNRNEGLVTS